MQIDARKINKFKITLNHCVKVYNLNTFRRRGDLERRIEQ